MPQAQEAAHGQNGGDVGVKDEAGEERARNQRVQQGGFSAQDHLPHVHDYVHNEGRHACLHSPEDRFHGGIGTEGVIPDGDDGQNDQRRDDGAQAAANDSGHACGAVPRQRGEVDGNGSGRGLRDGGHGEKLLFGKQPFFPDKVLIDHRHDNVAAPERECPDKEVDPEEPKAFFHFFSGHGV